MSSAPQFLPADYFTRKSSGVIAPETLPADYFAAQKPGKLKPVMFPSHGPIDYTRPARQKALEEEEQFLSTDYPPDFEGLQKPLLPLGELAEKAIGKRTTIPGQIAAGATKELASLAGGMTSPANIAMLGGIVAAHAVPVVGMLVDLGFSVAMAREAVKSVPEVKRLIEEEDYEGATAAAVRAITTGAMSFGAGMIGKRQAGKVFAKKAIEPEVLPRVKSLPPGTEPKLLTAAPAEPGVEGLLRPWPPPDELNYLNRPKPNLLTAAVEEAPQTLPANYFALKTETIPKALESSVPVLNKFKSVTVKGGERTEEGFSDYLKRKGKVDDTILYSNPLMAFGKAYTRYIGEPLWESGAKLLDKATPEFLKRFLVTRYGQPEEYIKAAKGRKITIALGKEENLKIGGKLEKGLSQEEQQSLGRLIKGEATESELLKLRQDQRWNEAVDAAKVARARLDDLGSHAVIQDLLKEEAFFRTYGKYMPRMYRKWEVPQEELFTRYGERKPTRLDRSRFLSRKDIPEEVRLLDMGEILEPGYPVAKGLTQLVHDVETQRLFNFVASNDQWAINPRTATRDLLNLDLSKFTKMPDTPKLGKLSGQYVLKPIAEDLNQIVRSKSEAEKMGRALMSEWKWMKVVAGPATHARNMMANTILAYLNGLSPLRLDIYARALHQMVRQSGKQFETARAGGLFSGTFNESELGTLLDSWNRSKGGLMDRLASISGFIREGKPSKALNLLRPSQTKIGQKASDIYQAEESWFKLAKFMHNQERGMGVEEAIAEAQKSLFDYSEVPKFIDWARHSPLGAPFITFTYKALPLVAESAIKYPWRILGITATLWALEEEARRHLGISADEFEKIRKVLPERMKGSMLGISKYLLFRFKDAYNQLQLLDLTYLLPWGNIGETGAGGMPQMLPLYASPLRAVYEVMHNWNDYTGKEIYKRTDDLSTSTKKISMHLYRTLAPSLAPGGYGFERIRAAVTRQPDYFGRVSSVPTALVSSLLGLKTTPIDPKMEAYFRTKEKEDDYEDLKREAWYVQNHQGLSKEEKKKRLAKLREKVQQLAGKK